MNLHDFFKKASPIKVFALVLLLCAVLLPPSSVSRIISVTADMSSMNFISSSSPERNVSSFSTATDEAGLFSRTDYPKTEINVYFPSTQEIVTMDLEEYIAGVVAAETGASFYPEALEAQAIAARSFALYKKHYGTHASGADVCTDFTHCQAYVSENAYSGTPDEWSHIKACTFNTASVVLTYGGQLANTLYHDSSPDFTESIENVWPGKSVPYLVSVRNYTKAGYEPLSAALAVSAGDFIKKLLPVCGNSLYDDISFSSYIYSPSNRVSSVSVNGTALCGTELRSLFKLNSSCFELERDGDSLIFNTLGNGHGVGMSQRGANVMAESGFSSGEILRHYYPGCTLTVYDALQP